MRIVQRDHRKWPGSTEISVRNDLGDFMVRITLTPLEDFNESDELDIALTPRQWWEIVKFIGITTDDQAEEKEDLR